MNEYPNNSKCCVCELMLDAEDQREKHILCKKCRGEEHGHI